MPAWRSGLLSLQKEKVPGLCTSVAVVAFGEATVGVWTSSSVRGPSWQDNEDIFPQSVHVSSVIVWEDEDIINNTALESEWAAVATATQNLPTDTLAGCSRIKSNQKRIHCAPHRARMRTHANNILNSQTQNREEAPSAPTCCFHCPVVYCEKKKRGEKGSKKKKKKKKYSSCSELVGVKGSIPSAYSLHTTAPHQKRGYVYLFDSILQVSAGKLRRKEGGSDWRLEPLISLEKVCTRLGGPEWPFADKTAAEETGMVDKWDIRIQRREREDGAEYGQLRADI